MKPKPKYNPPDGLLDQTAVHHLYEINENEELTFYIGKINWTYVPRTGWPQQGRVDTGVITMALAGDTSFYAGRGCTLIHQGDLVEAFARVTLAAVAGWEPRRWVKDCEHLRALLTPWAGVAEVKTFLIASAKAAIAAKKS